jgi:hypothetical protein
MAEYPPFMNSYGVLSQILEKAKHAKTPDRFTVDYLKGTLGFKSSSARAFIPLAKRLGLLNSDGTPSDLYKSFRNPSTSNLAMAEAIRKGYAQFFERNEKANTLPKKDIEGLVVEMTGLEKNHPTTRAIVGTFEALKSSADFAQRKYKEEEERKEEGKGEKQQEDVETGKLKLGLSYTINLVLPKTDDVAVFNAIFKSLRDNLLKQ